MSGSADTGGVHHVPRIVHMMHFPWDKQQRLLDDPEQFDKSTFYAMQSYARDFDVTLWTYPKASALCREFYPSVWESLAHISRPVMLLDVLRWVVVHRYGGVYWQMNSCPLVAMEHFLPSSGRRVRLFTEFDQTPEHCLAMRDEPIRNGEPEETKRVLIQVFSAAAGAAYVAKTIDLMCERLRSNPVKRDYDVLYITGNAVASTAYNRYGKNDPEVEIIDLARSKAMIKWHYRGAWRTDVKPVASHVSPSRRSPRVMPRMAASLFYRLGKRHPHDDMLAELNDRNGCLAVLRSFIKEKGVSSIIEFPCGRLTPDQFPLSFHYIGGDSSLRVIEENRRVNRGSDICFVSLNLFHSKVPGAEMFISADYFERVSMREIARLFQRLMRRGFRYLALSHHPLLTENWDTALGDYRPLNYDKPPFSFPSPVAIYPAPVEQGRPDRSVAVWACDGLPTAWGQELMSA